MKTIGELVNEVNWRVLARALATAESLTKDSGDRAQIRSTRHKLAEFLKQLEVYEKEKSKAIVTDSGAAVCGLPTISK